MRISKGLVQLVPHVVSIRFITYQRMNPVNATTRENTNTSSITDVPSNHPNKTDASGLGDKADTQSMHMDRLHRYADAGVVARRRVSMAMDVTFEFGRRIYLYKFTELAVHANECRSASSTVHVCIS